MLGLYRIDSYISSIISSIIIIMIGLYRHSNRIGVEHGTFVFG